MVNRLDIPSVIVTLTMLIVACYGYYWLYILNTDFGVNDLVFRFLWTLFGAGTLMMVLGCVVKYFGWTKEDLESMAPKT